MRTKITSNAVTVWLSANDTYDWANTWPCSTLSDKRLCASFDENGLYNMTINGGRGNQDCDSHEFSAMIADYLVTVLSKDHPAYFVAVEQHLPD